MLKPNERRPVASPAMLEYECKGNADECTGTQYGIANDERNGIATEERCKGETDEAASRIPRDVAGVEHEEEQD